MSVWDFAETDLSLVTHLIRQLCQTSYLLVLVSEKVRSKSTSSYFSVVVRGQGEEKSRGAKFDNT